MHHRQDAPHASARRWQRTPALAVSVPPPSGISRAHRPNIVGSNVITPVPAASQRELHAGILGYSCKRAVGNLHRSLTTNPTPCMPRNATSIRVSHDNAHSQMPWTSHLRSRLSLFCDGGRCRSRLTFSLQFAYALCTCVAKCDAVCVYVTALCLCPSTHGVAVQPQCNRHTLFAHYVQRYLASRSCILYCIDRRPLATCGAQAAAAHLQLATSPKSALGNRLQPPTIASTAAPNTTRRCGQETTLALRNWMLLGQAKATDTLRPKKTQRDSCPGPPTFHSASDSRWLQHNRVHVSSLCSHCA